MHTLPDCDLDKYVKMYAARNIALEYTGVTVMLYILLGSESNVPILIPVNISFVPLF